MLPYKPLSDPRRSISRTPFINLICSQQRAINSATTFFFAESLSGDIVVCWRVTHTIEGRTDRSISKLVPFVHVLLTIYDCAWRVAVSYGRAFIFVSSIVVGAGQTRTHRLLSCDLTVIIPHFPIKNDALVTCPYQRKGSIEELTPSRGVAGLLGLNQCPKR